MSEMTEYGVPTLHVKNLSEYLQCINLCKDEDLSSTILEHRTFFRGQSNREWALVPSLYRGNLLPVESLMLKKLKHLCPNEFAGERLEILAKFQHFGMPTRLLDVTTNPLVALYFACCDNNETDNDGIVYIFPNQVSLWSTDPIVDVIMDFVFELSTNQTSLDNLLAAANKKQDNGLGLFRLSDVNAILRILTHKAYAVMPTKANPRIAAQDGAFFICGMEIGNVKQTTDIDGNTKFSYTFRPIRIDSPQEISAKSKTVIVPAENKSSILNELRCIGISEHTLFPDLSHQINYVVNSVKDNIVYRYM